MKKNLFLVALAATALASCSQDEIVEVQQDAIKFNVVTENQTRAADVYCQNNLMSKFTVYGTYTADGTTQMYMNGDVIEKQTDGSWKNTTTTRYWSDTDDAHNFYAIENGTITLPTSWANNSVPTVVGFTPDTDVSKQVDLVYAVATGKDKADADAQVTLNFRHALSQIEFKAKNTNAQMYVEIEAVRVGNAPSKGDFTFPTASTDNNIVDHTTEAGATEESDKTYNKGTWALSTETTGVIASYTVDVKKKATEEATEATAIPVSGNNTAVNLTISTHTTESAKGDYSKSMLLVPNATANSNEGTTAWTPAENLTSGTYLAVKCNIYNVADAPGDDSDEDSAPVYNKDTDVLLHEGWAIVPASFKWEPGKKYIYTFVFGEGNGGYDGGKDTDPNPDPEEDTDENPEPVLVPMTYDVTVDDFVKGSEEDVDMKTQETTGSSDAADGGSAA